MSGGRARIAVLVSGGGTNLGALIKAQNEGILQSGRIEIVISNKAGVFAIERAKNAGIDHSVIERKDYPDSESFEMALISLIDEYKIDLIVLAGFMAILSENFTARYSERIINIHPSLIPSFCGKGFYGLKVHKAALDYGVRVSGATVHFVNEVPDGGKIILQKAVDVMQDDTPETLQRRIMEEAEWIILPRAAELVCREIISKR